MNQHIWNKRATAAALLVHSQSSPSMKDCIFLQYILEIKPNKANQALNDRLTKATRMGELLLGWSKGGHGRLTL